MPNSQHDREEHEQWIVVTKNKNKHKGAVRSKQVHHRGSQNMLASDNKEELIQKFMSSKSFELNKKVMEGVLEKIQATSNLDHFHVQCLGLGNFLANKKCFIQWHFMELIIMPAVKQLIAKHENLKITEKSERPLFSEQELSVNVYDPAFSKVETQHINSMNYTCLSKYQIKQNKINVFFMPHCERNLYESVYQQYEDIKQKSTTPLLIIGNSIQQYKERCMLIKQQLPDIFAKRHPKQERIYDYENALNDTFILI